MIWACSISSGPELNADRSSRDRAWGFDIVIADNGRGFDCKTPPHAGNGLQNMRRRLADIGGEAEITSEPGRGTTVRLRVPATL